MKASPQDICCFSELSFRRNLNTRAFSLSTVVSIKAGFKQSTKLTRRPFQNALKPPSRKSWTAAPAAPIGVLDVVTLVAIASTGSVRQTLAQPPRVRRETAAAPEQRPKCCVHRASSHSPKVTVANSAESDLDAAEVIPEKRPKTPSSRTMHTIPSVKPL
eukprot:CAMPEP_0206451102 /NCGR_PEP_ID=MMETSP0324_2-20121206/19129_1 /ASSEMBLY_ACC=CAM_ASM_000836 /TAXON_ID=2866 /ORGANISM="Crypthecodinium cohnii, Strain Seligo" /LENGTH=159 /DNA_ID=CAMNT_0053920895 /DNA_START=230 /DNA_END=709 /DNA_ORIENTATION=+